MPISNETNAPRASALARLAVIVALPLIAGGCASGFVSGGVATATAQDGRVDVEGTTASASVGPGGAQSRVSSASASVCIDPATNIRQPC